MRSFFRHLRPLVAGAVRRAPGLVGGGSALLFFSSAHAYDASLYSRSLEEVTALKELDDMHEFPDRFPEAQERAYLAASVLALARPEDASILYRFARAAYNLSQHVKDPIKKVALLDEALRLARDAKRLDSHDCNVLRWSGIILQAWSETQPTAEYIKAAFAVKDDWLAAVEANPSDARAWHLLGRWAQAVAAMPYWKRSIAAALFATPPTATLAEARDYFARAEALSPGDWIDNRVGLAQCALGLGDAAEASRWALAALELPVRCASDARSRDEALRIARLADPAKHKAWEAAQAAPEVK